MQLCLGCSKHTWLKSMERFCRALETLCNYHTKNYSCHVLIPSSQHTFIGFFPLARRRCSVIFPESWVRCSHHTAGCRRGKGLVHPFNEIKIISYPSHHILIWRAICTQNRSGRESLEVLRFRDMVGPCSLGVGITLCDSCLKCPLHGFCETPYREDLRSCR